MANKYGSDKDYYIPQNIMVLKYLSMPICTCLLHTGPQIHKYSIEVSFILEPDYLRVIWFKETNTDDLRKYLGNLYTFTPIDSLNHWYHLKCVSKSRSLNLKDPERISVSPERRFSSSNFNNQYSLLWCHWVDQLCCACRSLGRSSPFVQRW